MSDRLDRIEAILERVADRLDPMTARDEVQQLQIDVVVEQTLESQAGQKALEAGERRLQQIVESLAKSVQAHCDDDRRHQ
ncbi:MAG: hypothetical protein WA902_14190 [Thermosynechococcaceae cyanobacterium]